MKRTIRTLSVFLAFAAVFAGFYFFFGKDTAAPEPVSTENVSGFYWEQKTSEKQGCFTFYLRTTATENLWHLSGSYYNAAGEFIPFDDVSVNEVQWAQIEELLKATDFYESTGSTDADGTQFTFILYYTNGASAEASNPALETRNALCQLLLSAVGS